jgi:hypothetical protein
LKKIMVESTVVIRQYWRSKVSPTSSLAQFGQNSN